MKSSYHYLKVKELDFCRSHTDITGNTFVRVFSQEDKEFMDWHRDEKERHVTVLYCEKGSNWKFQYDNKLPFCIDQNSNFSIGKEEYHRIICGAGVIVLYIKEII